MRIRRVTASVILILHLTTPGGANSIDDDGAFVAMRSALANHVDAVVDVEPGARAFCQNLVRICRNSVGVSSERTAVIVEEYSISRFWNIIHV